MTELQISPQGKFQFPAQYLSPNVCIGCGNVASENNALDLKKDIKFYGVVYLCSMCIASLAKMYNFISPEEYEGIANELAGRELEVVQKDQRIQSLEQIVDGYRNLSISHISGATFDDLSVEGSTNPDDDLQSSSEGEEAEVIEVRETEASEVSHGDDLSPGNDREFDGSERDSNEPSSVEESGDVRSDSSDNTKSILDL